MDLMWAEEVIISHPKGEIIVGTIIVIEPIGWSVGCFVSAVQTLDHLLVRPEFLRDSIFVCKSDDLCDLKLKLISELTEELLGGKWISAVTVSDEAKVLRQLFQMLESHAHRHDTRTDTSVAIFLVYQGVIAIRATKVQRRKTVAFCRRKAGITDFTEKLTFRTVVPVEVDGRCFTAQAGTLLRNIAFLPAAHRFDELSIPFLPVRDQFLIGPILFIRLNEWKFIHLEFLVLGGMGVIESPLLKRDISADKVDQPAILLIKLMA